SSCRPRHRRHRLHALALARQHEPRAIVAQRTDPILVADHARKPLDIGRKPHLTGIAVAKIHRGILLPTSEPRQITDSQWQSPRLSDSVKLVGVTHRMVRINL